MFNIIKVKLFCLVFISFIAQAQQQSPIGAGIQKWNSYKTSLPLETIQENCRPKRVPHQGEYRGVVLFFHGFTACPQQYFEFAELLSQEGYEVLMPLTPGHGRKWLVNEDGSKSDQLIDLPTGRLTDENSYKDRYMSFIKGMNKVASAFPGDKVVGGLSTGAVLATHAGIIAPQLWNRQLIMSPMYEFGNTPIRTALGTVVNIDRLNQTVGSFFDSIFLSQDQGWGEGCENERDFDYIADYGRDVLRAGICQFKVTHVLGVNQIGFEAWQAVTHTSIRTQFVAVQGDPIINKSLIFDSAAKMRGESLGLLGRSRERFDNHNNVRVCYLPSSNTVCAANATLNKEDQDKPCINHSLLSRYDAPFQNKYWIDTLQPKLINFVVDGKFLEADTSERTHGDPICTGFKN